MTGITATAARLAERAAPALTHVAAEAAPVLNVATQRLINLHLARDATQAAIDALEGARATMFRDRIKPGVALKIDRALEQLSVAEATGQLNYLGRGSYVPSAVSGGDRHMYDPELARDRLQGALLSELAPQFGQISRGKHKLAIQQARAGLVLTRDGLDAVLRTERHSRVAAGVTDLVTRVRAELSDASLAAALHDDAVMRATRALTAGALAT